MFALRVAHCADGDDLVLPDDEGIGSVYARHKFDTRTDPSESAPVKSTINEGYELVIISESEDRKWYWVRISEGIYGWAMKEHLADIQPPPFPAVEYQPSPSELTRLHHVLALEKTYSFNFEFWAGRTYQTELVGEEGASFTSFVFGPGIGQELGIKDATQNLIADLRLLIAHESYRGTEETALNFASFGALLSLRYFWVHNPDLAGGLSIGVGGLKAMYSNMEGTIKPSFALARLGISVTGDFLGRGSAWVVDLGAVGRPRAIGFAGALSLVF